MRPFHLPGVTTFRIYKDSEYIPTQGVKRLALSDVAYAAAYGYAQTRHPTPGVSLPAEAVEKRLGRVAERWEDESKKQDASKNGRRVSSGLDPAADLPSGAQYWLAERLMPLPIL